MESRRTSSLRRGFSLAPRRLPLFLVFWTAGKYGRRRFNDCRVIEVFQVRWHGRPNSAATSARPTTFSTSVCFHSSTSSLSEKGEEIVREQCSAIIKTGRISSLAFLPLRFLEPPHFLARPCLSLSLSENVYYPSNTFLAIHLLVKWRFTSREIIMISM